MDASARERPGAGLGGQALAARLTSGIVLGGTALAAVWDGGWFFTLFLGAFLLVGLWEFLRMASRAGYPVLYVPGLAAGVAVFVLAVTHEAQNAGAVLIAVGAWMIVPSIRAPIEQRIVGLALTLFGVAYVIGLGIHLLWLREMEDGFRRLAAILLGTWAADTFAFFVGLRFGRHPLAPDVSPSKSVEGFVGGVLGAIAVTVFVFHALLGPQTRLAGAMTGLVIGCTAPAGDLLESLMKRNFGRKDASHMIPGHGGVLDRIDSLLVTAPIAYYLLRFLLP